MEVAGGRADRDLDEGGQGAEGEKQISLISWRWSQQDLLAD